MPTKTALLVVVLLHVVGCALYSQSGHYWTNQFGSKATLLGNSLIGSVDDLGAVYYNPGRLAQITNPEFIFSGEALQFSKYTYVDPFGANSEVSSSDFVAVPSLIAGTFGLGKRESRHVLAYSFLNRNYVELDLDFRVELSTEVLDTLQDVEALGVGMNLRQRVRNQWYSVTYSYPVKDGLSVGVTMSGVRLLNRKDSRLDLETLGKDGFVDTYLYSRNFRFDRYGLLWKLGIAGTNGRIEWGATVTTPLLNLFGKGDYRFEEFASSSQDSTIGQYSAAQQQGLKARYKMPWSFGAGMGFMFEAFKLHTSVEWFLPIKTYVVMDGDDHYSQSSGELIEFRLVNSMRNTVNAGLGIEYYLNEKVQLYGRFNTDFGAVNEDPDAAFTESDPDLQLTVFTPNFYHYGGGVLLNFDGAEITLGIARSSGNQKSNRPIGIPDDSSDGVDIPTAEGTLKWVRWQILVGLSFKFLEKISGQK